VELDGRVLTGFALKETITISVLRISAQNMSSQRTGSFSVQVAKIALLSGYFPIRKKHSISSEPSNPFFAMEPFLNRQPGSSSGPRLPLEDPDPDPDRVKKSRWLAV
jgi:hypothetical protein